MKLKQFIFALVAMLSCFTFTANAQVAQVGDTKYATIDEAIAKWTNGTTLTLLANVTLSKPIELSSTEHHILNLGSYKMTAASKKSWGVTTGYDAIKIVNNGRSTAGEALTINADAAGCIVVKTGLGNVTEIPAVVRTTGKSNVQDRPIITFNGGRFESQGYVVYHSGSDGTNSPQYVFNGGIFEGGLLGTIYTDRAKMIFNGGTFKGTISMSVDSSSDALINGGRFEKLSNSYGSSLNKDKFTIGSAAGEYDREVYVDDEGYYVVATAEPAEGIEAAVAKTPGTNDYLAYSKVATEGQLNYTDVETALKNNTSATVTVYAEEVDMSGINFKGTIVLPENHTVTIKNAPANLQVQDGNGKTLTANANGTFTSVPPVAKIDDTEYATLAQAVAAAQAGDEIVLTADVKTTDGVVITDKNLTIDLNGKTYTVTEGANTNNRNFKINGTSVVTVKNGTMVAAGEYSSGAYGTIRTEGTANVTLTGLKLYNYRGNGLNIKACTGTTVTIENTEIYANYGGGIESAGGTIVVNDGVTVEQKGMYTAPYNSMAISVNGGGKVTVNGGTFSTECLAAADANNQGTSHGPWVAGVLNSGGTLIINGGTFSNDNFGENSLATAARGAILADTKAKVEINGGTFNVLKNVIDIQNNLGDTNNNPSVLLVGGTYSADPRISAQYGSNLITLAEDYIAVENNGVWNVVRAVAKIGEQGYATLNEAFAAAAEGATITLLADATPALTSQRAITKAAVIDLGGKTMTLTEDDLYFGTTTFKNGTIVVDPSVKPSTAVFWMFANQTLTFDKVKVVATGVTGTYLIGLDGNNSDLNLLNGSEILVENTTALDLDIICVNASTGNDIKVENSKVNVTNLDGRVFFRGNYTVAGNSEINLAGITKAGFRIEAGQTLSIEGTSKVTIVGEPRDGGIHLTDVTSTYTKAATATVNATLNEPAKGSNSPAYVGKDANGNVRVWGEGGGNAKESFELKLYAGETLIATSKLNNIGGIINGNVFVTWNFFYPESNDEYWTTTWEEGHPNSVDQPTKLELVIDGTAVATTNAMMCGPDNLNPVKWEELGGVKYICTGLKGEGTEANPYLINNVEELLWFQAKVDEQAADGSTQYAGKYIKLTADIDLAGINWNPIGSMTGDHGSFKGVFDGDNHTISNLNIEQAGNGLGLFAYTSGNAVIKNLKLNNVTVKSTNNSNYVGGVVGNAYASTKIENVHVTGDVLISGRGYIGGIAGHGYVVMDNVSVVANEGGLITSTFWCAGGVLGYAGEGTTNITNAHVEGLTVTSAAGGLGAIVGMAEDNNGTQPISGSNLSAKNVAIKTYVGAYGTSYADYALGYLYGGNETSKLTGNLVVENVTVETSSGVAPTIVDAVATVGDAVYFDFAAAFAAAQAGQTVSILKAGTYALKVKDGITITGAVEGVEFANIGAFGCNGANVTFNNVTFTYAENSTYKGLQHSGNLVYNNCTFNGQVFLYGQSETFNNCTFNTTDSNNYNVWTYGAKNVAFNGCTFNSAGKSVLIYAESAAVTNDVTVTKCTFKASQAVEGKAAIEMDSSLSGAINLTIDGETTATGFGTGNVSGNSLWNNKKGNSTDANNDITVKVGDETVLAPVYEAQIGEQGYRSFQAAIAAAKAGDTVTVFEGTYAMPSVKAGITIVGEGNVLFEGTLTGSLENLTMKNIHIKGGNAQRWAYAKGNLVFENVTFEATSVYALHFDGITEGATLTYKDCTIIGWAAMSGSPASCVFDGCTFKGNGTYGLIRTYFDATINKCTFDVANVNTTDIYQDGIHAVSGATVIVTECTNVNGDMKDVVNVSGASVVILDGEKIQNAAKIGDTYYATFDAAYTAAKNGDTIELLKTAVITNFKQWINYSKKNITVKAEFGDAAFRVQDGAYVWFGGMTIESDDYCIIVGASDKSSGANVEIYGGTYKGATTAISVTKGDVKIMDGTFSVEPYEDSYEYTINCVDASYQDGSADVAIQGGKFYNFNPANNAAEGATTNFLVAGYATTQDAEGYWEVVKAVAQIGKVYYATLTEAIKAAKAGDVVTVFEGTYAMPSMKAGIAIEGVGNVVFEGTLTGTLENLTMKNIHIKGGNAQRWAYAKGNLVFENVTFEATSVYALHFDGITEGANLTYKNCTIIGWAAMSGSPASCVFDGCTFMGNGTYGLIRTYFNATIENCTFDVANVDTTDNYQDGIHAVDGAIVTVYNCTNANGEMADVVNIHATSVVVLDGVEIRNVAKIGDNYYATLQDAINAAVEGATVIVLTDIALAETVTVPADKTITLDLNGKTIAGTDNGTASFGLITNKGNLTIVDGSEDKNGKITLTATTNRGWNAYSSVISNTVGGKLTVNGGTIEHLGGTDMAYAIDNLTNGKGTYAETVINDGTVKSTYRAIRQFLNGVEAQNILTVNGGTIEGANKSIWMQGPNTSANPGALTVAAEAAVKGDVYLTTTAGTAQYPVSVSIAAAALKDGAQVLTSNVPGHYVVANVGGVWQNVDPVAAINGKGYATLAAAIAAVQAGDNTIELLADCAEKVTITQVNGTNIVINGNGKTYTGTITVKGDKVANNLYNTETLTFQNIIFAPAYNTYAITAEKNTYARNITVDGCTFKGNNDVYGIRVRNGYNYTVKNTTAEGVYTFFNASEALAGLTVENVTVECANVAFAGAYGFGDASFKNVTVESDNNGVKVNNPNGSALTFENCSITAKTPVTFIENAGVTSALTAEFNGTNTMVVNNGGTYWFNIVEADGVDATFKAIVNDANLDMSNTAFAASVGNVYYSSLQKAIDAAVDNGTVVVARNIELDAEDAILASGNLKVMVNVVGKNIILDMNGKEISLNHQGTTDAERIYAVVSVEDGAGLTVTGEGSIDIDVNDATPKVAYMFLKRGSNGYLVIENGNYHMDGSEDSMVYSSGDDVVVINGGTFILDTVGTGNNGQPWIFNTNGKNDKQIIVNGGTFNADVNHQYWAFEVYIATDKAVKANGDGTWTVVSAVAYVKEAYQGYTRETGYATLADAVASKYGNEITMVADAALTETVVVPAGKVVVLDLNGKTISAAITEQLTKSFAAIQNKGTLTVKDASDEADGKITVSYAGNSFGYGVGLYTISNEGGVLNIEGGTIENTTTVSGSMYDAIDNNSTLGNTVLNISGGEVVCGQYIGVRQFANSTTYENTVNVTGGKVVGGNTSIWMQNPGSNQPKATIAISGADYENENYPVIEGRLLAGESTGFIFNVTGGLFNTDVNEFCAEDYASYNFGDGTWGVESLYIEELTIVDGEYDEFEIQNAKRVGTLTYKRSISAKNANVWQPLYVPFDMPVSALGEYIEVAYFNDLREKVVDGEIVPGQSVMELVKVKATATLKANYPYVIRTKAKAPDTAREICVVLTNAKLHSTIGELPSVECSSAIKTFRFTGTYKKSTEAELLNGEDGECFAMSGGELAAMSSTAKLGAFRLYMVRTTKKNSPYLDEEEEAQYSIALRLVGEEMEDGTTLIYDVEMDEVESVDYIFDLQGRRVLEPQKGDLYIINGKKVIF